MHLTKRAIVGGLRSAIFSALDASKELGELKDVLVDAVGETANEAFKSAEKMKADMEEFRSRLEELAEKHKQDFDFPLLFLVDELDRCRPDFALMFLETIKHLFDTPGVVFVLAVDRQQLANLSLIHISEPTRPY